MSNLTRGATHVHPRQWCHPRTSCHVRCPLRFPHPCTALTAEITFTATVLLHLMSVVHPLCASSTTMPPSHSSPSPTLLSDRTPSLTGPSPYNNSSHSSHSDPSLLVHPPHSTPSPTLLPLPQCSLTYNTSSLTLLPPTQETPSHNTPWPSTTLPGPPQHSLPITGPSPSPRHS